MEAILWCYKVAKHITPENSLLWTNLTLTSLTFHSFRVPRDNWTPWSANLNLSGFKNTASRKSTIVPVLSLRSLLQGHLDKLAHDENRFASVSTADGLPRNHVRQGTTRTLVSLFEPVTVTRLSYSQRQASSLFPLDAQLNLHVD